MASAANDALINLIYLHLKDNGYQKAASVLKKHVPKGGEGVASTSLCDIYNKWTAGLQSGSKAGENSSSTSSVSDDVEAPTTGKPVKLKKKSDAGTTKPRRRKQRSGPEASTACRDESDSDSSLDVEKWKKLALELTDADIARMEAITSVNSMRPSNGRKTSTKKPAAKTSKSTVSQRKKSPSKTDKSKTEKSLSKDSKTEKKTNRNKKDQSEATKAKTTEALTHASTPQFTSVEGTATISSEAVITETASADQNVNTPKKSESKNPKNSCEVENPENGLADESTKTPTKSRKRKTPKSPSKENSVTSLLSDSTSATAEEAGETANKPEPSDEKSMSSKASKHKSHKTASKDIKTTTPPEHVTMTNSAVEPVSAEQNVSSSSTQAKTSKKSKAKIAATDSECSDSAGHNADPPLKEFKETVPLSEPPPHKPHKSKAPKTPSEDSTAKYYTAGEQNGTTPSKHGKHKTPMKPLGEVIKEGDELVNAAQEEAQHPCSEPPVKKKKHKKRKKEEEVEESTPEEPPLEPKKKKKKKKDEAEKRSEEESQESVPEAERQPVLELLVTVATEPTLEKKKKKKKDKDKEREKEEAIPAPPGTSAPPVEEETPKKKKKKKLLSTDLPTDLLPEQP